MIKRPKQIERSQKGYLSNEKYQDYAESQFKTIYDYLDELTLRQDYSLEEKEIGTWVDGKKIYRKTIFLVGTFSAESSTVVMSDSDIDTIINMYGITVNDNIFQTTIPYSYPNQNMAIYRHNGNIYYYTKINISNVYITLEYTKK